MAKRSHSFRNRLVASTMAIFAGAAGAAAQEQPVGACAAQYYVHLAGISGNELATLRAAANDIGEPDRGLPGRMIVSADRAPRDAAERSAYAAAVTLARRQGRTGFATDANTRWIASRIREDLSDYLRQQPTPYLCSGVAPYLETLREYARRGAPSPARVEDHLDTQRQAAGRSLDAVRAAMRPVPEPRFAPVDRPGRIAIEGLRLALEANLRGGAENETEQPVRVAAREAERTQLSESRIDPDLPPLDDDRYDLETPSGLLRTLDALVVDLEVAGFMATASQASSQRHSRPVLTRLARLESRLAAQPIADPRMGPLFTRALSDLEALDYLLAAHRGTADPLNTALHATMDAIEQAHATACTCAR